jgi:hypothetical protein
MSESESHRRAKARAAGKNGEVENPLPGKQRLDALTPSGKATEVERSGVQKGLEAAAKRLKQADAKQHVLQVPQKDMAAAVEAMKKVGVGGTVKNMAGTKRVSVTKGS